MTTNKALLRRLWDEIAASHDNGKGIPLREYDPDDQDDMNEMYYGLLKVIDPIDLTDKRLQSYILRSRNVRLFSLQSKSKGTKKYIINDSKMRISIH